MQALFTCVKNQILNLEQESKCQLKELLVFATGANEEPPLEFDPVPSLQFLQDSTFPEANTCSDILHVPIHHETYEEFKNAMELGLLKCAGFGKL